ncbi:MAG: PD-(D/E)XK nuclease family protein [Actinobacteria bacterium]|nr:PD-(D/E)XK nuclease family protein [Actinomycetota bacterium]
MKLSYSAISSYQTCPLQYYYRYVEKKPSLPSPSLSFGTSLHEVLNWFYSVPTPDPYSLDEMVDQLEKAWVSEGYCSPEEETRYFLQGRSTLEIYYRNNIHDFHIPAALEHGFGIDMGFCTLTGVIDRLDKHPDGGFEIIDYKTNRRLPPARRLDEDLQLPIYQIAAEDIWKVSPEKVTFYYLLLNHRHSFKITDERKSRAIETIKGVAGKIESGLFDATRNNLCPWCDYIDLCPEWKDKPKPQKSRTSPALDIGQAVDELVLCHKLVTRQLSRIESLKDTIRQYLGEHDIERIGGSEGIAYIGDGGELSWEDLE